MAESRRISKQEKGYNRKYDYKLTDSFKFNLQSEDAFLFERKSRLTCVGNCLRVHFLICLTFNIDRQLRAAHRARCSSRLSHQPGVISEYLMSVIMKRPLDLRSPPRWLDRVPCLDICLTNVQIRRKLDSESENEMMLPANQLINWTAVCVYLISFCKLILTAVCRNLLVEVKSQQTAVSVSP